MKTIALKEKTFILIKDLKDKGRKSSFDELIMDLVLKGENIEKSMFGSLKGKTKRFTPAERKRIWRDKERILE
ncbi:MAG: hypothetical protein Q7S56_01015 [Nanoarchaeota archaeon]|nr:hypothetical protein [Nanoarchaeota archaeon]